MQNDCEFTTTHERQILGLISTQNVKTAQQNSSAFALGCMKLLRATDYDPIREVQYESFDIDNKTI